MIGFQKDLAPEWICGGWTNVSDGDFESSEKRELFGGRRNARAFRYVSNLLIIGCEPFCPPTGFRREQTRAAISDSMVVADHCDPGCSADLGVACAPHDGGRLATGAFGVRVRRPHHAGGSQPGTSRRTRHLPR